MNQTLSILQQMPVRLVPWHRQMKRALPWRAEPSAYHTWLSEIMLQQTRIEAVIPYYYRFLQELPTIEALAAVPEDRLLKLWEGLGYYSRARNLKKAAQKVMEEYDGQLPVTAKELRTLPGIGEYTAGAIASIAFGQPEPAVDGNVLRVITRVTGDDGDIMQPAVKKRITESLRTVYPNGRNAGDFTEGLMELGETVCIPGGVPKCDLCPVADICIAKQQGRTCELPVKSEKKQRKIQQKTVFILYYNGSYALCRRPEKGLLAGMWEFPCTDVEMDEQQAKQWGAKYFTDFNTYQDLGKAIHIFTHIEWHMRGCFFICSEPSDSFVWVTAQQLTEEIALPVAFRHYKQWIFNREGKE